MPPAENEPMAMSEDREQGERDDPATRVPPAPPGKEPFFEQRRRERGARKLAKENAKAEEQERAQGPAPDTVTPPAFAPAARAASPSPAAGQGLEGVSSPAPGHDPDHDAIREAAEREALARLAEAERRSDAEHEPEPDLVSSEVQQHVDRARLEAEQPPPEPVPEAPSEPVADSPSPEPEPPVIQSPEPRREALLAELREAESKLTQNRAQEEELARELALTEERFAESKRLTDDALERAAARLNEIEARAVAAERRAEQAEKLAAEKGEEAKRTERLREMLDRIAEAEERASAAEQRARIAVERVTEPTPELDEAAAVLDRPGEPEPEPFRPESEVAFRAEPEPPSPEPFSAEPLSAEPETAESEREPPVTGSAPVPDDAVSDPDGTRALSEGAAGPVAINTASYEELRALGLSVTQTGRLLAQRERNGRFESLAELDGIPGFPQSFLDQLKRKLTL